MSEETPNPEIDNFMSNFDEAEVSVEKTPEAKVEEKTKETPEAPKQKLSLKPKEEVSKDSEKSVEGKSEDSKATSEEDVKEDKLYEINKNGKTEKKTIAQLIRSHQQKEENLANSKTASQKLQEEIKAFEKVKQEAENIKQEALDNPFKFSDKYGKNVDEQVQKYAQDKINQQNMSPEQKVESQAQYIQNLETRLKSRDDIELEEKHAAKEKETLENLFVVAKNTLEENGLPTDEKTQQKYLEEMLELEESGVIYDKIDIANKIYSDTYSDFKTYFSEMSAENIYTLLKEAGRTEDLREIYLNNAGEQAAKEANSDKSTKSKEKEGRQTVDEYNRELAELHKIIQE